MKEIYWNIRHVERGPLWWLHIADGDVLMVQTFREWKPIFGMNKGRKIMFNNLNNYLTAYVRMRIKSENRKAKYICLHKHIFIHHLYVQQWLNYICEWKINLKADHHTNEQVNYKNLQIIMWEQINKHKKCYMIN